MSHFLDQDKAKNVSSTLAFRHQDGANNIPQQPVTVAPPQQTHPDPASFFPTINQNNIKPNKGVLPFLQRTNDPNYPHQHENEAANPTPGTENTVIQGLSGLQQPVPAASPQQQQAPQPAVPVLQQTQPSFTTPVVTIPPQPTVTPNTVSQAKPTAPSITNTVTNTTTTASKPDAGLASQNYIQQLKANLEKPSSDNLLYGTIPNTISMASIPRPAIKSRATSTTFITLESDEDGDSDEDITFDSIAGLKKDSSASTSTSTVANPPVVTPQPSFSSYSVQPPATPTLPVKAIATSTFKSEPTYTPSVQKKPITATLNKFSYKDDDDNDSDDDIIITGVSHNLNASFGNGASSSFYPPAETKNIFTGAVKRERFMEEEAELARKRQEILKKKQEMVMNNVKREQDIQLSIHEKAKLEKKKIEKARINELLKPYPPIKALPMKYQIAFPPRTTPNEPVPILPDMVSHNDVRQDLQLNIPLEFRASVFRQQNIDAMASVMTRLNKINDLHKRLDVFLKSAAQMRKLVQDKATKTAGLKKADIRYNQILRFMDPKIQSLSAAYGNLGAEIELMKKYRSELINRSSIMERLRGIFIMNRQLTGTVPKIEIYKRVLPQLNLVVNTITDMCKLTNFTSQDALKVVREFSLTPARVPFVLIPQVIDIQPQLKGEYNDNDPFTNMLHQSADHMNSLNNQDDFMPYSNVYGDSMGRVNPYMNVTESEGIKNLMDSIKVTEIEEEGLAPTPDELCISLLKHQRIGLSWMLKMEKSTNKGGILADDMGLGKTVQAISLMLANKSTDQTTKTNLIIGPVSLLNQWQQEIQMKLKDERTVSTYMFHSTNRASSFAELAKHDVVLVSYQTLGSEWKKHYKRELAAVKSNTVIHRGPNDYNSPFFSTDSIFYRIILDEAQYIKNKATIASKSVASLTSTYRWCLSGTPIQNKIDELYPLIRFLGIAPYNDWNAFNQQIVQSIKHRSLSGHKKIHALLSAVLLRRTKDSEIDGKPILTLPEKHIIEEKIKLEGEEKEFYDSLELLSMQAADKLMKSQVKAYSSILTLLLRMRQSADHEYLVRLGDDGDRVSRLERFTKGREAIDDYSRQVEDRIINTIPVGFSCMMCHEELADSQTLLLSVCGHPVCYECHDEYFEEHLEARVDDDRTCRCSKCGVINLASKSVDLRLFIAIQQGMSWPQIRRQFELDSRASDKAWRLKMIRQFIEEDGKMKISAKIRKTVDLVKDIIQNRPDEKVIVFSQFIGYFDIIKFRLNDENIDFLQYDGSMDIQTKNDCINAFYKDPSKKLLLLSLKAGNVGLTLTCANHVIIAEPFWNPYVEKQAQDRVHRISQTKEVYVHRLLVEDTVEDRIIQLQKEKEELVESALDPAARSNIGKLSRRELGFLFGLNGLSNLENE